MYYTHGDMVVYRSDQRDRLPAKKQARERLPEYRPDSRPDTHPGLRADPHPGLRPDPHPGLRPDPRPEQRRAQPSAAQQLTARIAELEERLAHLESALETARQPAPRPSSHRWVQHGDGAREGRSADEPGRIEPGDVRVSLYAQGGTQASVGPVRVLQQD